MEATISKVNNTQQNTNVQNNQSVKNNDKISDTQSFKEALKDVNSDSNKTTSKETSNNQTDTKSMEQKVSDNVKQNDEVKNTSEKQSNEIKENLDANILEMESEKNAQSMKDLILAQNKEKFIPKELKPDNKNDLKKVNKSLAGKIEKEEMIEDNLKLLDKSLEGVSDKAFQNNVNADSQEISLAEKSALINTITINTELDNKLALQSLSDLNSKISAINSLASKTLDKTKTELGSIKVSAEDAKFFVKLVENQTNDTIQTNVTINTDNQQVSLTEAKAKALQSSAAVSQALIEKLQDSMKTNKSFRVDFDNDVAVIMKVDKSGVLSANFIPGSSAVEQYLRNNLAELRQTLDDKGIEYKELSYSNRKQNQQKQQRNNKGGQDE